MKSGIVDIQTSVPRGERAWYEPKPGESKQEKAERERLMKIVRELEKQGVEASKKAMGADAASMDEVKHTVTENMTNLLKQYGDKFVTDMLISGGMTQDEAAKYVGALRIAAKMQK